MFELMDLDFEIPIKIPLLDVKVGDIQVDIRPSETTPLPLIHIEAKLDIRLGF
jgi:hypothetical protein